MRLFEAGLINRIHYRGEALGTVKAVRPPLIYATLPRATLGDICHFENKAGHLSAAEVIGFQEEYVSLAPLEELLDITAGSTVTNTELPLRLPAGRARPGMLLDAMCAPYDHIAPRLTAGENEVDFGSQERSSVANHAPDARAAKYRPFARGPGPLERKSINQRFITGIRAIDAFCPVGYGQRIGLFAGAGTGKSTLLSEIVKNSPADINVVALVGERGREVYEFVEKDLSEGARSRTIVIAATSDESPQRRRMAPFTATMIAEHYQRQGRNVLLIVDSLTRTARALRDLGLAAGEIPVRQGYPASVYTALPRLLERAGKFKKGSITAIYSVLTSGDEDPLEDEVRGLLDGHIRLCSDRAARGIRPAIDIVKSLSRLAHSLHDAETNRLVAKLRGMSDKVQKERDLLLLGAVPDKDLELALAIEPALDNFLNQTLNDFSLWSETQSGLQRLKDRLDTSRLPQQAQGIAKHVVRDAKGL